MKKPIMWAGSILAVLVIVGTMLDGSEPPPPQIAVEAEWQEGPPEASYILVERTVKKFAHDPGSIAIKPDACSRTGGNADDGWLVTCDYRGKNALGATVLNTGDFRIIRAGDGYAALPE